MGYEEIIEAVRRSFRYLEIMPADQFWDRVGQPFGLGRALFCMQHGLTP